MRTLTRNKQDVYYALYDKTIDTTDEYGNLTGESTVTYSDVKLLKANVSPAKGDSQLTQFGINDDYTRTIVTDKELPISETSKVWIGYKKLKPYDAMNDSEGDVFIKDGKIQTIREGKFVEVPYNHAVVKVAKSINSVTYALKEVNVS